MKATLLLFSVAALLMGATVAVRGQSALDGFDPTASEQVLAFVVQPDGKILVGGDFTTFFPNGGPFVTRNRIARLNTDGTVDATFNPNANGQVSSIALQPDGKILAAGGFTSIGGVTRNHIAQLNPDGTLDAAFDPNADGYIQTIAVQADGKILVGGFFTQIGGQTRSNIARLDATTGLADSFNPNADNNVWSIVVQADGKILLGGGFTSVGGQARNYIARLDPTTGLADSFDPHAINGGLTSIAVQADGKILVGGNFAGIGGQTRNCIARLDPNTGLADSFNPNATNTVYSIVVQADGKILTGGYFQGANSIGGQARNCIARLDSVTGLADSFDPSASSAVYSIAVQPDGKILAGGRFSSLSPNGGGTVSRNYIARLESDGRLDQTLNLGASGSVVMATAVQPDGKTLVGGTFSFISGDTRSNIARLNSDGGLDAAFNPSANGQVDPIAVQADGKILVGGFFTSIGGQPRNYIARLDPTTGLADSFDPNADGQVYSIVVQPDGKILVGGAFTNIGGQPRNHIARLDPATGLADSFNPSANEAVYTIAVQADGKILVGGNFAVIFGTPTIGGQPRNHIARLDPATGLADSFNPNASNIVEAIALQADGKILVGGDFVGVESIGGQRRDFIARLDPATGLPDSFDPHASQNIYSIVVQADGKILAGGQFGSIGGQNRNHIARLDPTTGLADSFDPNTNSSVVFSLAVQPDGKIFAGGNFTTVGGQPRNRIARLNNDTAALQNLAVTRTNITWTRGGGSPLLTRVTFEYSTDNVTYTPLGNGTSTGSNWTLTDLNFATGQSFYIRARGYCHSGKLNGSKGMTESVRNVFLTEASLRSAVSRKVHGAAAFDVNLPLTGNPGVECRSGGGSGDYQMIFSFANTLTSVGNASITSGAGSISSRMMDADPHNYIVNLTGVSNAQMITVSLTDVNDSMGNSSSAIPVSMRVLIGDTNGNGTVNASDVGQTKAQIGQGITGANFRTDVNVNGTINASDVGIVKAHIGTSVPTAAEGTKVARDSERSSDWQRR